MEQRLSEIADLVWSYPVVGLCLLSAVFFTLRLGFIQLRVLPHAIALLRGRYDDPDETGAITHLQALSAALSGTIGIGNIAGVAIAISVGGPGAVLWMWVAGLFGMATKFVECTLGTAYRSVDPVSGAVRGGPMNYIVEGLGPRWRPVAVFYAVTIAFAGFGFSCMFQSNQAASALELSMGIPTWVTGLALAVLTGAVILGGIVRIGRWAARIVPLTCLVYVGGAMVVCAMNLERLPDVLALIWREGSSGGAVLGGGLGGVIAWGVRRAVFSNEAGLGSAAIAHAAVKTDEPIREGVVASLGPMIDTIIVSGATAFVILLAGNYGELRLQPLGPAAPVAYDSVWSELPSTCEDDALQCFDPRGAFGKSEGVGSALVASLGPAPAEATAYRVAFRGDVAGAQIRLEAGDVSVSRELGSEACPAPKVGWRTCAVPLSDELRRALVAGGSFELRPTVGAARFTAPVPVRALDGIALSSVSFDTFIRGFGTVFITFAGFFFALSTMITWSYYGETAGTWIFGERVVLAYRASFVVAAFLGSVYRLGLVISISDILVGLLVVPNVVAITLLSGRVAGWSREYFARLEAGDFDRRED